MRSFCENCECNSEMEVCADWDWRTKRFKIPKFVTNGDVIEALFPDAEITEIFGSFDKDKLLGYRTWLGGHSQDYYLEWWNAPYRKE